MRPFIAVRRVPVVVGVLPLLALLLAAPVAAAPLVRTQLSGSDSFTEELCDEEWSVENSFEALFMLKAGHQGDPTPLFFYRESYRTVYTDPEDDSRGFVISGHTLFKDVAATRISGTTYQFDSMQAGQPMVISTLDGHVIGRDRGRATWQFLVDTHGSSDPNDYEVLDVTDLATNGPHPIGEEPCSLVAEALQG
jgi:hypothetical protein